MILKCGYGLLLALCILMHRHLVHPAEVNTDCTTIYSICYVQNDLKINEGDSLNIIEPNASSIKELYFNQNSLLVSVPYGIFENFPELELCSISNSGIEVLQSDRFVNAKKLRSLRLDDNEIRIVPSKVFVNVPTVTEIYLQNNKIETIEDNAFEGMVNLRILRLDHNLIGVISRLAFVGASYITELKLDFNSIATIEEGALSLPSLEELNLSTNKLKIVHDTTLTPNLVTLSLSKNPIENVNLTALADLEKLKALFISGTMVKFLPETTHFITKSKLKRFWLQDNGLTNPYILRNLSIFGQLEQLWMDNNNFTVLEDAEKIRNYFPNLKELRLEGNDPPLCDWIKSNQQWLDGIIVWSGKIKFNSFYGDDASTELCGSTDFSVTWYIRKFIERS